MLLDAEKLVVPLNIVALPEAFPEQLSSRVEPNPVPLTLKFETPTVVSVSVATPTPPIPTHESWLPVPPEAGREATTLHESEIPPALAVRSTVQIKFFELTVRLTVRDVVPLLVVLVKVTVPE